MKYYTKEWYNSLGGLFLTSGLKVIPDKKYSNKEIKQFYEEALQKEIEHDHKLYDTPPSFYYGEEALTLENFVPENYFIIDEETGEGYHPKTVEELREVYEKDRKEAEERFKNRPPFDETKTIECFRAVYRGGIRYGSFHYPEWLCKEVDKRLLALNLIPKSAYKRLKEEEKADKRAIDKLEKEAERVLKSQDIPEEIASKFRFHDADVLSLKRVRSDVEMYLNQDGMQAEGESPYAKVTFKRVSMLDRERGLVFRKKIKNDGMTGSNCQFLYHELYRTEEGYEVHMMLWATKELRYVTIKCEDIEIEDNIEYCSLSK